MPPFLLSQESTGGEKNLPSASGYSLYVSGSESQEKNGETFAVFKFFQAEFGKLDCFQRSVSNP